MASEILRDANGTESFTCEGCGASVVRFTPEQDDRPLCFECIWLGEYPNAPPEVVAILRGNR